MGLESQHLRSAATMDKVQLEKALTRLGQLLRERRVAGEVAVFGGAKRLCLASTSETPRRMWTP